MNIKAEGTGQSCSGTSEYDRLKAQYGAMVMSEKIRLIKPFASMLLRIVDEFRETGEIRPDLIDEADALLSGDHWTPKGEGEPR